MYVLIFFSGISNTTFLHWPSTLITSLEKPPKMKTIRVVLATKNNQNTKFNSGRIQLQASFGGRSKIWNNVRSFPVKDLQHRQFIVLSIKRSVQKYLKRKRGSRRGPSPRNGTQFSLKFRFKRNKGLSVSDYLHFTRNSSSGQIPMLLLQYDSCSIRQKRIVSRRKNRHVPQQSASHEYLEKLFDEKSMIEERITRSTSLGEAIPEKCGLTDLVVSFAELGFGLGHRVLMPSRVNIRQCIGTCHCGHLLDYDLNMTNHARFKHLYRY